MTVDEAFEMAVAVATHPGATVELLKSDRPTPAQMNNVLVKLEARYDLVQAVEAAELIANFYIPPIKLSELYRGPGD